MAESRETLLTLASKISELAQSLTDSLQKENVPLCTLDKDSPPSYASPSPDIYMQRQSLVQTLTDMIYLTQGPQESIFNYTHSVSG